MIPALPEPAYAQCLIGTDQGDNPIRLDLFTRAQLEQYARDYHAAMLKSHVPAGWRNRRAPKVLRAEPPHPDFLHLWEQLFTRRVTT